jgi:hypothetical protein
MSPTKTPPTKTQNESPFPKTLFPSTDRDLGFLPPSGSMPLESSRKPDYRIRDRAAPVLVEATVHWWRSEERRGAGASNQFGVMPTIPVRFRCIGSLSAKFPQRYRVDLAQALDWLPELSPRELRHLSISLVEAIAIKLGVDVPPFACDVMDLEPPDEDAV